MPGAGTRLCEALVSLSHPECSPHIHTHTHTHTSKSGTQQLPQECRPSLGVPAPQVWAERPVGPQAVRSRQRQVTLRSQSPRAPGRAGTFAFWDDSFERVLLGSQVSTGDASAPRAHSPGLGPTGSLAAGQGRAERCGHAWCAQVSQLSRTQDAGSREPGGAHVSGAGQRPEAKDHSVPPADTGQQPVPSEHGRRETHAGPGKPDTPPPCWGGPPSGQARRSARHLRGLCLSGGPERRPHLYTGYLICIVRQPPTPPPGSLGGQHSRI